MFNEPFSFLSNCSSVWQIHHFLAIFLQSDHYLVGCVKVSILISTDTEKPQLSMKFPYKTCVCSSFFGIYCLERIYYPAGSRNPKLEYEANKEVCKVSKIKSKNKIKTLVLAFSCYWHFPCLLQLGKDLQYSKKELTFILASCKAFHVKENLFICCSMPIFIGITRYQVML